MVANTSGWAARVEKIKKLGVVVSMDVKDGNVCTNPVQWEKSIVEVFKSENLDVYLLPRANKQLADTDANEGLYAAKLQARMQEVLRERNKATKLLNEAVSTSLLQM